MFFRPYHFDAYGPHTGPFLLWFSKEIARGELSEISTPEALLNKIFFNNTIHFRLRGCKEHRDMCWGDVQLHQTTNGEEFLEYSERQSIRLELAKIPEMLDNRTENLFGSWM